MRKVEIKNNQVVAGAKHIPLLSGEVHYWRLNPRYWKTILESVRGMGIQVVSTYVPWDYHEARRGFFDFTGETDKTRDLKGFLELTKREGFWLIIRPGPYIYSEWPNDGIPSYAYKYHRLHPKFLEYAQTYLTKVCKVFKPFLASRKSGHIILLQADNEIDPFPDVFGHQYGLAGKPGMFQEFLREKYQGDIHLLNRAWASEYHDFKEAGPFIACMLKDEPGLPLKGDRELRRNLDYFEFKYHYAYECAKWNVDMYRKLGVDIPIYLNLYPFFYAHDWAKMQGAADLVGIDLYPSNELMEDEHEQRKLIDKVRFLRSCSKIPYIAEFASGVWHARHYESGVLTPNHYRLITLSALLGGVMGWNWYMLVNRDNWYMSPINEWGRKREELYQVFKGLVHVFNEMKPYLLTKMTDIAVTLNPMQYAARTFQGESKILSALYEADIDYELFDPETGVADKKIIFYSGNQWLSRRAHENLRHFVEGGGILVAFRNYPRKDEYFEPCPLLGFHDPSHILFEFRKQFTIALNKTAPIAITSSVYSFRDCPGKPIRASFGNYGVQNVGYIKPVGKGKIVHLGFHPTKEILREILRFFGIEVYSNSSTKDIKTALFKRGDQYFLVAVNNGREDKSGHISFVIPRPKFKHFRVTDLFDRSTQDHVHLHRLASFSAEIPRKDGRVFELRLSKR